MAKAKVTNNTVFEFRLPLLLETMLRVSGGIEERNGGSWINAKGTKLLLKWTYADGGRGKPKRKARP